MKKTALITGVAGGIGKACAELFIKNGVNVAGFDIAPDSPIEENENFSYFSGNLADKNDRENYVAAAIKRFGRIDILVNVAGVAPKVRRDLLEMTEESYDFVMNINTKGTLFLTQAVANVMKENKGENKGAIVNISSMSGYKFRKPRRILHFKGGCYDDNNTFCRPSCRIRNMRKRGSPRHNYDGYDRRGKRKIR